MRYRNYSFSELKRACTGIDAEGMEAIEKSHEFMLLHSGSKADKGHQLNTAFILAKTGLDASTVCAALVHEVLFTDQGKKSEMEKALGAETTKIAEDVARLKSVKNENYGKMANTRLSKVIMGIAKDFRSLFVELASQLDKMRHIEERAPKKREALAELVREVYSPIAHKLGLYELEWEMRDLALKYFKPREYERIKGLVGKKREQRERFVESAGKSVERMLKAEKINAVVSGRAKSFSGIHRKMAGQKRGFEKISDLNGIRIICDSVEDCYRVTGLIHMNYRALGEYDDYIASPKQNNYQSIHTVFEWKGERVEAQIRTWEMHRNAEEGVAAHWRYKRLERDKDFDQRLGWVKQLVEWQRKIKKTSKSMRSLKLDFGVGGVFVLTPKKEIITLPEGATALDFAYAIHSDLGHRCKSTIVNGKISHLGTVLESGDVVSVNVSNKPQCKPAWLNIVVTEKARDRIRKGFGIKRVRKEKAKKEAGETTGSLKKTVIARCCNPLPGEKIRGYRTTKRKVTIHSCDCPFLELLPEGRKIEIVWGDEEEKRYSSKIIVRAFERAGILIDLLSELEKQGVAINSTETKSEKGNTINCVFDVELKDARQFERVRGKILSIPSVLEVGR